MGGSSGGGGGGAAGKIDYPLYVKHIHADWLAQIAAPTSPTTHDTIETSVTDVMNTALGGSPYATAVAFDPSTELTAIGAALTSLAANNFTTIFGTHDNRVVTAGQGPIAPITEFNTALVSIVGQFDTTLYSTMAVNADITAYGELLSDEIDANSAPRLARGMQDINAIQSSSFVIAQANLEDARLREVNKYGADLRKAIYIQRAQFGIQAATNVLQLKGQMISADIDAALRLTAAELEFKKAVAMMTIEGNRLSIVAQKEEADTNLDINERDSKWDLEVFQYGANVLASAVGGTVQHPAAGKSNKWASAIGGAMAGAAAGSAISPGYGTAIGAIVGGVAGYLSA